MPRKKKPKPVQEAPVEEKEPERAPELGDPLPPRPNDDDMRGVPVYDTVADLEN